MLRLETHHRQQRVGAGQHLRGFFRWLKPEIGAPCMRALKEWLWPVRIGADYDDFQIVRRVDFFDQRTEHASVKIFN